ncbi:hypothetical protein Q7C36_008042 [Tachysurus vachellii]|uniref:Uncharacterized protein n=1 Tax=Tachysurus vachellii TaxID=175792 RepID=A0AA88T024_TACVA|nr:hypothetical protein Q7C36_008042 [Tachysurus vachellii]
MRDFLQHRGQSGAGAPGVRLEETPDTHTFTPKGNIEPLGRFSGLDFSSARRAKFLLPLKSKRILELLACLEDDECRVPVEKGSIVWAKSDWVKAVGLFCSSGQRDDDDDDDGDDEAVLAV